MKDAAQQAPVADIEAVQEAASTLLDHTDILPIGITAPLASFHSDLTVMIEDYHAIDPKAEGDQEAESDQGDQEAEEAESDYPYTPDQAATPAHE